MRTLKVTMAYRGTRYHGFQRQPNAVTVQETVERCLSKVLNEPVTVFGCSRTDTGVHANCFVFHVKTERQIRPLNFVRGVNGELPADISILSCEDAEDTFHARFSCCGKEYLYLIHNSESKNPFLTDLAHHYRRPMDLERMQAAADRLVGIHDFKSFCASAAKTENTVRTVYSFSIEKLGDSVKMLVKGDGFLYNMVRICVGTLLWVNEGILKPEEIDAVLAARSRLAAGATAPAKGLYLNRVFYDPQAMEEDFCFQRE